MTNRAKSLIFVLFMGGLASTSPAQPTELADVPRASVAAILDKHCSRCHQADKMPEFAKPAADLGNILDIDALESNRALVKPGNPDASKLFQVIANREMPSDIYSGEAPELPIPTKEEIALLRQWISTVEEPVSSGCTSPSSPLGATDIEELVAADLGGADNDTGAEYRYIHLINLVDSCADGQNSQLLAGALTKLVNSLSYGPEPVKLIATANGSFIYRFDLSASNWTADTWDRLVSAYPYGVQTNSPNAKFIASKLGTKVPVIRADWLAHAASYPGVYRMLLGLPADYSELVYHLSGTPPQTSNGSKALAGFAHTGLSDGYRVIERRKSDSGFMWTANDFYGDDPRQLAIDYLNSREGEKPVPTWRKSFFTLPNGFLGFFGENAANLGKPPPAGLFGGNSDRSQHQLAASVHCMSCHDPAFIPAPDELLGALQAVDRDQSSDSDQSSQQELPLISNEIQQVMVSDQSAVDAAMKMSGFDPAQKLDGVELITGLVKRYRRSVDLQAASAELGVTADVLVSRIQTMEKSYAALGLRLQQGSLSRNEFESSFPAVLEWVTTNQPVVASTSLSSLGELPGDVLAGEEDTSIMDNLSVELTLFADRAEYKVDDRPVFTVQSNQDCHLTLININPDGFATVILPNGFQQEAKLNAGESQQVPPDDSEFQFAFSDAGKEKVVAICDVDGDRFQQIQHDFANNAFTELGNQKVATQKLDDVRREIPAEGTRDPTGTQSSGVGRTAIILDVK